MNFCGEASASLREAVERHDGSVVSGENIARLAEFDSYIRYFTSFSYIRPRHKVSPDFVRALILAESAADPRALSPRQARGLGQLLYPTALKASRELSQRFTAFRHVSHRTLRDLQEDDLYDPAVNILLTCYLIAKYNERFNGRLDLVVTAWNAGEYTETLEYGRHAPYRETEELIGKVNAYYLYLLRTRAFR